MHIFQSKTSKLKKEEIGKLLEKFNISLSQIPKINSDDAGLPFGCQIGDVVKIERKEELGGTYYRVVV